MSPVSLYTAGCALALAMVVSTSASAQVIPGLDLSDVTDTVDSLIGGVDPGIDGVDVGDNGDVNVGLLGDGGNPITIDPNELLGLDVPSITITTPTGTPGLPDLPDLPPVIDIVTTTVTDLTPDLPDLPDLPDFPDIDLPDFPGDDDGDVIIIGGLNPDVPVADDDTPRVLVINNNNGVNRVIANTTNNSRTNGVTGLTPKSSKLRMLLAILQNRGWLRFAAGNGVCLPPFAVTQVSSMLNNREERELNGILQNYANDIMTMRQMMANCRNGTRITAGDINRVIGVGISSNGSPMLYVL